jgi:hypothetical protein
MRGFITIFFDPVLHADTKNNDLTSWIGITEGSKNKEKNITLKTNLGKLSQYGMIFVWVDKNLKYIFKEFQKEIAKHCNNDNIKCVEGKNIIGLRIDNILNILNSVIKKKKNKKL